MLTVLTKYTDVLVVTTPEALDVAVLVATTVHVMIPK